MPTTLCPTCNQQMQFLNQYQETGTYSCLNCGTIAVVVAGVVRVKSIPRLVGVCRTLEANQAAFCYKEAPSESVDKFTDAWIEMTTITNA